MLVLSLVNSRVVLDLAGVSVTKRLEQVAE